MKLEVRPFENTESKKQSEKEWKKQRGPKVFSVCCKANICVYAMKSRKEVKKEGGPGGVMGRGREEWGTQGRR